LPEELDDGGNKLIYSPLEINMGPTAITTISAAHPNTIWYHRASVQSSKLLKSTD